MHNFHIFISARVCYFQELGRGRKLQVSFAKETYERDDILLQKRPMKETIQLGRGRCGENNAGFETQSHYGVATVSRIDKMIGLFCRIAFLL